MEDDIQDYIEELEKRLETTTVAERKQLRRIIKGLKEILEYSIANDELFLDWDIARENMDIYMEKRIRNETDKIKNIEELIYFANKRASNQYTTIEVIERKIKEFGLDPDLFHDSSDHFV